MPIMLAMMPSPSTTRTTIAPKLAISNRAMNVLSMRHHRYLCAVRPLHLLPVAGLLEGVRGTIDGRLIEMSADQHQADRKPVDHAAGDRHRRVVRNVEWRGIADHLERTLHHFFAG